jgi:hypothetical protein
VRFTSIFPACYSGRWPHIHFEVYPDEASITDAANAIATSQVALPEDACTQVYAQGGYQASVTKLSQVSLDSDNVFGDDGGRSQLASVTGDVTGGYTVSLAVGVDTPPRPAVSSPATALPQARPVAPVARPRATRHADDNPRQDYPREAAEVQAVGIILLRKDPTESGDTGIHAAHHSTHRQVRCRGSSRCARAQLSGCRRGCGR